jgi:hypothetical protein
MMTMGKRNFILPALGLDRDEQAQSVMNIHDNFAEPAPRL